jgi:gluconokinase
MGVAGSGKTTVGPLAATRLGVPFVDGDDFHTDASIERMHAGRPLDDTARGPWLDRLHAVLEGHRIEGAVLACSALTVAARARLAGGLMVHFVLLDVPPQLLAARLQARRGHFAGVDLLDSQLATLERGPDLVAVDADRPPAAVAAAVVAVVGAPRT